MNFSVCVDAVFNGKDFYESVEKLAQNGFRNIEFWTWWDKDLDRLAALKEKYGLTYVAFCTKFFSLVKQSEREDYLKGFEETCEAARRLGCSRIITKPLDATAEPFSVQYERMKTTLQLALEIARRYNVTIVLEPVNSAYEAPNTFVDNSALAFRFVDDIQDPHLKVLYDIYHMQIDEGDVLHRILPNIDKIAHIHTAGSMERHELSDGELNYDYIFDKLAETTYDGYIGLEYFPVKDELEGLRDAVRGHM